MALFKRKERAAKSAASVSFTPRLVEVLRTFDGSMGSYGDVYRRLAPVRTVVDFLADAVSTTSLKVYRRARSGRPEAYDHPLAVLLRHPNSQVSPRALIAGTVKDLGIYGNAYWQKVSFGSGPSYLVPIPPARVVPRGGTVMGAAYYDVWPSAFDSVTSAGATPVKVPREQMVHFRFYDPEDRRVGASKLEAVRTILAEEVEMAKHREGFWQNAARQDLILRRPFAEGGVQLPPWDNDARNRFREDWQAKTGGSRNAGRSAVLEDGLDAKPISFSAKDSEFIEGRLFILEATARVFNVPVSLLGLTQTATFASQKEFHKQLYQDTLPPWYELIQSEIELQLLPDFESALDPDVYVEFNVESKLRGSFEEQADILFKLAGRPLMTGKEGRDLLNLPDIPGDTTLHEVAYPANNVAFGSQPPVVSTPDALPSANGAAPKSDGAARALELKDVLDRQQRSVLSRVGAGGAFDPDRWNRELALTIADWNG